MDATIFLPSIASSSSSSTVAIFCFLDAGASSSSPSVSTLVRLDLALLAGLVAFDAGLDFGVALVFVLDAGLGDVAPLVVGSEGAAPDAA